jgi:hypothetical protein
MVILFGWILFLPLLRLFASPVLLWWLPMSYFFIIGRCFCFNSNHRFGLDDHSGGSIPSDLEPNICQIFLQIEPPCLRYIYYQSKKMRNLLTIKHYSLAITVFWR